MQEELVLVPVGSWDDVKVGAFYLERGAYRKVLDKTTKDGKEVSIVSYHVMADRINTKDKRSFLEPEEFKHPLYYFDLEDYTMFGARRVTYQQLKTE